MQDSAKDASVADRRARSPFGRAVGVAVGIVLALGVGFALAHVFVRPIPPGQDVPTGHFEQPCWLCHLVTDGADPVEVP